MSVVLLYAEPSGFCYQSGGGTTVVKFLILTILFLGSFPFHAIANHELKERDVVRGQLLYVEQCASCHGVNLEGQPNWRTSNSDGTFPAPPHDETGHTWHHDNAFLFSYTKLGGEIALKQLGIEDFKSGMPAFSEMLSDEEIWDVLAYIQSTWSERIQEMQASRNPPH